MKSCEVDPALLGVCRRPLRGGRGLKFPKRRTKDAEDPVAPYEGGVD